MLVWSVVRVADERDLERLAEAAAGASVVLVEPQVAGAHGGTGAALPLDLAALARERLSDARMALAGGLRPDTVQRAIALVRPDIVDVSSGVESAPGVKDADLLARFLEVTRDARPRG
jgi:phosphoribosylanthranilate isomerase